MKTSANTRLLAMTLATVLAGVSPRAEADTGTPPPGMAWRIGGVTPARNEDWTGGWQTDVQLRLWQDSHLAFGISVGLAGWTVREEYQERMDGDTVYATSVSGDTTLVPIGASLLYWMPLSERVACVLEGGLRYVLVSSGITGRIGRLDASGEYIEERTIEINDFVQGVVSATLEGSMANDIRLVGGIGYQFDLTAPEETYAGRTLGETSFDNLFFSIGLAWNL